MIDVCLLGTGGMMPMPNRFLTAMLVRIKGRLALVDCGEGTQVTMKSQGWGFKSLDVICFTHFHADHISGLVGLLLTIGNADRTEPLTLIGPKGLLYIVEGLRRICPELPYELNCMEIEASMKEAIVVGEFEISFCAVDHTISCFAYRFDMRRKGKFDIEKAEALHLPKQYWGQLQKQAEIEIEGIVYTADMVLGEARSGIAVAYCTDSRPVDELIPFVKGVQLFICEGMYGADEKKQKAKENKHMTFSEAAKLAKAGGVGELWLTHFSPSLTEPEEYISVAQAIFEHTKLGEERMTETFVFPNE